MAFPMRSAPARPDGAPLRAGIYARKSEYRGKHAQRGRSVREQLDAGREDCARLGATVAREFVDDGRSASKHADGRSRGGRDEFDELLEWIREGRLDIVVCWQASRLQRDLAVYVQLRDACWAAGVLWCYGGRVYDLPTPTIGSRPDSTR